MRALRPRYGYQYCTPPSVPTSLERCITPSVAWLHEVDTDTNALPALRVWEPTYRPPVPHSAAKAAALVVAPRELCAGPPGDGGSRLVVDAFRPGPVTGFAMGHGRFEAD